MILQRRIPLALLVLPVVLILAGFACHKYYGPSTSVFILNHVRDTVQMNDQKVPWWTSGYFYVPNGETLDVALSRADTSIGTIVIASLLPAGDPGQYDAAINLHDTLGELSIDEFSPYINATLESVP